MTLNSGMVVVETFPIRPEEFDGGSVIVVKLVKGPSVVILVGRAVVEILKIGAVEVTFKLGRPVVDMFPGMLEKFEGGRAVVVKLNGASVVILAVGGAEVTFMIGLLVVRLNCGMAVVETFPWRPEELLKTVVVLML